MAAFNDSIPREVPAIAWLVVAVQGEERRDLTAHFTEPMAREAGAAAQILYPTWQIRILPVHAYLASDFISPRG